MNKLFFTLSFLCIVYFCFAQPLQPIERNIGKLTLSIDPRMEVLSAVQMISDYPVIQKNNSYSQSIDTYFRPYDTLAAVQLTDQLKSHFTHDAPVVFMLNLSQPENLNQKLPYPQYLIYRAKGEQNLENYRIALQEFVQKSNFKDFWNQNRNTYNQILEKTVAACQDIDWIKALEDYYNETQNSYNIIISPSFAGGYGPRIKARNGKWDIYACLSTTCNDNHVPYLDKNGLMYYLWHEFSHSYVNPEFEKYEDRIIATQKLFQPIKTIMTRNAYNNWGTCVNEHIVRAIHLRLIDLYIGHSAYEQKLQQEMNAGFVYIEPILQKLQEYETLKETTSLTFSAFVPKLIDVLDSLADNNYQQKIQTISFRGPINYVFNHKAAVIYPTNIQDSTTAQKVQQYVQAIFKRFFKSSSNLLLADTSALQESLEDYSIVVYGNVLNNLYLNHHQAILPFSMNDQELIADQRYTQPHLKIVSCQPHPQNKELGMIVYSSLSDEDLIGINNVFHGPEDYVIFTDRNHILKKGFYQNKATGKWTFWIENK